MSANRTGILPDAHSAPPAQQPEIQSTVVNTRNAYAANDIEELNKTGKRDTNGPDRMNEATVFVTDMSPCFGLVPARGGIIAVGRSEIIFLTDRDGDGATEVRETLFSGHNLTILERSINNPRWGLDN